MDVSEYKTQLSLPKSQLDKITSSTKKKMPDKLIQEIRVKHQIIISSLSENTPETFCEAVTSCYRIIKGIPKYKFEFINEFWDDELGRALHTYLLKVQSTEYILPVLCFMCQLLKIDKIHSFYSNNFLLAEIALGYISKFPNDLECVAQSLKMFSIILDYYQSKPLPCDLKILLNFFQDSVYCSARCQKYIARSIVRIIININFVSFTRKIVNIIFLISQKPLTLKVVEDIIDSLYILSQCDVNYNYMFLNTPIIPNIVKFYRDNPILFKKNSPCHISFLKLIGDLAYKIDYKPLFFLLKAVPIDYLKQFLFTQNSESKTSFPYLPYVLNIFIQILLAGENDRNLFNYFPQINNVIKDVLSGFVSKPVLHKEVIINFVHSLLRQKNTDTYRFLMEREEEFFYEMTSAAVESNNEKLMEYQFSSLIMMYFIACELCDAEIYLDFFIEAGIEEMIAPLLETVSEFVSYEIQVLLKIKSSKGQHVEISLDDIFAFCYEDQ
ncbi:hypothetical protein TRFO_39672 [Tritrichomonas foetus]|uniref:Uncharacterized protein n=1 Tax=Tritrichomonas foetus TaxID=1144522 RepID=A0A1J4J9N2_9EUKA|nr:hypothetical protein TRFO_39672 [Tritrichomonas foetus]|eukprot:OHS94141.1 hypothetical protein TRFO_39672 [Tritrichomonas foetus]